MYRVNLLPPKLQREEVVDLRRLLLVAGITVLAVCIIGAGAFFAINYFNMRGQIAAATAQAAILQPTVANVENIRKQRMTMEAAATDYKALLNKEVIWSSLLYDLNNIAPTDLWLTKLEITSASATGNPGAAAAGQQTSGAGTVSQQNTGTAATGQPGAKGKSTSAIIAEPYPRPDTINISGASNDVPAIGIFVKNLRQLPYFDNVIIKDINYNTTDKNNHFDITAHIKGEING
jgi:Tfp pilus assembly protein PilN